MCSRSLVLGNPGTPRVSRLTRILAAAALCGLASVSYAQTQTEPNTFAITPFFGWMAGGGFEEPGTNAERDVDEDLGFGIFLNLMADVPERQYELFYAQQNSTIEGTVPVDVDVQYLQIGGTVAYPQSEHVIPYFGLTIGGTRLSQLRVTSAFDWTFAHSSRCSMTTAISSACPNRRAAPARSSRSRIRSCSTWAHWA
jgi:hypothetical protein